MAKAKKVSDQVINALGDETELQNAKLEALRVFTLTHLPGRINTCLDRGSDFWGCGCLAMQSNEHGASPSGYPLKPILARKEPSGEGQCDHLGWNS
jgi:hypothetical protein